MLDLTEDGDVKTIQLTDDGHFPNHPRWPLLLYRQVFEGEGPLNPSDIEKLLASNNWSGCWRNGVFSYHHYHSNAHECLFCYSGQATVQFGGPEGAAVDIHANDAAVLPAGTAHKKLTSSTDFKVIGAYPGGMSYDMNYGEAGERPKADRNIKAVPRPETDPFYGAQGPLPEHWN